MMKKLWYVSFFNEKDSQYIFYGPHTTEKIYIFLKNMYVNLPQTDRDKKNFLVVDCLNDIHFQPDTLFEILSEEFANNKQKLQEEENSLLRKLETGRKTVSSKYNIKKRYSNENSSYVGNRAKISRSSRIDGWTK